MASYDWTMALVGPGLEKAQEWFSARHEEKSAELNDPNWTPSPVTEPTAAPTEAPTEITEAATEATE